MSPSTKSPGKFLFEIQKAARQQSVLRSTRPSVRAHFFFNRAMGCQNLGRGSGQFTLFTLRLSEWGHNLYGGGDQCVGEVGSGGWAGSSWHAKDCICLVLSRIIARSAQRKFPDCMPKG